MTVKTEFKNVKQYLESIHLNLLQVKKRLDNLDGQKAKNINNTPDENDKIGQFLKTLPIQSREDVQALELLLIDDANCEKLVRMLKI